jgi:hypothetical protein
VVCQRFDLKGSSSLRFAVSIDPVRAVAGVINRDA